jgi:hypothetical protein
MMKLHKTILLQALCLAVTLFAGCADKEEVRPDVSHYVRISQPSFNLNVGETTIIRALVDANDGQNYNLTWEVENTQVAQVEQRAGHEGLIKALAPGKTVVKVETSDHRLKYYADVNVAEGEAPMRLLTIGCGRAIDANSLLLSQMATATGKKLVICNLSIPQASFKTHLNNIKQESNSYAYQRVSVEGNSNTQKDQDLRKVIEEENWDFIALEEATEMAGMANGYQTFLPQLAQAIKSLATNPNVKVLLHQTWAYAKTARNPTFASYGNDQKKMFDSITNAVMQGKPHVDMVIPTGTAIQNGRTSYLGDKVLKDDIDLDPITGRYIAALSWYETLFSTDVSALSYLNPSLSQYDNKLAKTAAHAAATNLQEVTDLTEFKEKGPNEFVLKCPIYVDFGPIETPAPFNNYKHNYDAPLANLQDSAGNSTYFNFAVTTHFSKPEENLVRRELTNTLGLPKTACIDMFWCDGKKLPKGAFKLSYLNKDMKYTFYFYGSINDRNTCTKYKVIGKNEGEAELVNDFNTDKMAVVSGIEPKDDGTIDIELSMGSTNTHWAGFFGINAMIITPEGHRLR